MARDASATVKPHRTWRQSAHKLGMNLQLRIEGPSGSRVQPLGAAGRPLIAGRDTGADIVLPDCGYLRAAS